MRNITLCTLAGVLLILSGTVIAPVSASEQPQESDGNGLSANQTATLWSRDPDTSHAKHPDGRQFGANRSLMEELAKGTDITFNRPPATAATWTQQDFQDLSHGDEHTSVSPPHAGRRHGRFIKDAHATVFAIQPSTRGHLGSNETPLYIAPNGTLRALIDYRIQLPNRTSSDGTSVEWELLDHEVERIRLKIDEDVVARTSGSHSPAISYQINQRQARTVTVAADLRVRIQRIARHSNSTETIVNISNRTEIMTVSDTIDVDVHRLQPSLEFIRYPNGDHGFVANTTDPWQLYSLSDENESGIRGIWRFYTARDPRWDTLVESTDEGRSQIRSDAIPVSVHAFPSRTAPRPEPVHGGPELVTRAETNNASPVDSLGENISVNVVDRLYTSSPDIAVRASNLHPDAVRVNGIVRGVNATPSQQTSNSVRPLRRTELSTSLLEQNSSHATFKVELTDIETQQPISLAGNPPDKSTERSAPGGYISLAGREIRTDANGTAVVTLEQPGVYRAQFQPKPWANQEPAYVGDSATIRWHPVWSVQSWLTFIVEFGWQLIPFSVIFYVGRYLLKMFDTDEFVRK